MTSRNGKGLPPARWSITQEIVCGRCQEEKGLVLTLGDRAKLRVGFTPWGIQIWCKFHGVNLLHIELPKSGTAVNNKMRD